MLTALVSLQVHRGPLLGPHARGAVLSDVRAGRRCGSPGVQLQHAGCPPRVRRDLRSRDKDTPKVEEEEAEEEEEEEAEEEEERPEDRALSLHFPLFICLAASAMP